MNPKALSHALKLATEAATAAGDLMRKNQHSPKRVNEEVQHDIKLELDVRCQKRIEKILKKGLPEAAFLGEEGVAGDMNAPLRWVVDPIDGTVNFAYGIPHCCVSIALQERVEGRLKKGAEQYRSVVGVVLDPFCQELWTGVMGGPARLNKRVIHVSKRAKLEEAIVSLGFAKSAESLQKSLPGFNRVMPHVRKVRIMGAAALALTYVASGRFDAYLEHGLRLWDIAAGGLIVECAGGEFFREPVEGEHAYRLLASNGRVNRRLRELSGF